MIRKISILGRIFTCFLFAFILASQTLQASDCVGILGLLVGKPIDPRSLNIKSINSIQIDSITEFHPAEMGFFNSGVFSARLDGTTKVFMKKIDFQPNLFEVFGVVKKTKLQWHEELTEEAQKMMALDILGIGPKFHGILWRDDHAYIITDFFEGETVKSLDQIALYANRIQESSYIQLQRAISILEKEGITTEDFQILIGKNGEIRVTDPALFIFNAKSSEKLNDHLNDPKILLRDLFTVLQAKKKGTTVDDSTKIKLAKEFGLSTNDPQIESIVDVLRVANHLVGQEIDIDPRLLLNSLEKLAFNIFASTHDSRTQIVFKRFEQLTKNDQLAILKKWGRLLEDFESPITRRIHLLGHKIERQIEWDAAVFDHKGGIEKTVNSVTKGNIRTPPVYEQSGQLSIFGKFIARFLYSEGGHIDEFPKHLFNVDESVVDRFNLESRLRKLPKSSQWRLEATILGITSFGNKAGKSLKLFFNDVDIYRPFVLSLIERIGLERKYSSYIFEELISGKPIFQNSSSTVLPRISKPLGELKSRYSSSYFFQEIIRVYGPNYETEIAVENFLRRLGKERQVDAVLGCLR